jgi:hypothetical protein
VPNGSDKSKSDQQHASYCVSLQTFHVVVSADVRYSIAFAALPLVWYVVGSRLMGSTHQETSTVQDCIEVYTKTMKACQFIYEGADPLMENVGTVVKHIKLKSAPSSTSSTSSGFFSRRLQCQSSTTSPLETPTRGEASGWIDTLLSQSSVYASIVSTIDFSLACGRFPKLSDLPLALQSPQAEGMFPLYASPSSKPTLQIASATYKSSPITSDTSENDYMIGYTSKINPNDLYNSAELESHELVNVIDFPLFEDDSGHDNAVMLREQWTEWQGYQQLLQGYVEIDTAN